MLKNHNKTQQELHNQQQQQLLEQQQQKPKLSGWSRLGLTKSSTQSSSRLTKTTPTITTSTPGTTLLSRSANIHPIQSTSAARISDLRKILNPEIEKEDSFKKFTESLENCDCFEFNLNNAAKLITVVVLLATFIMVIKALKGDR
ncbi:hypothetical protein QR98_0024400 [Sarcoptes scabiei]|nr:hypothetical protein QR98_0024400 [Sarcoptes scabiei]